MRHLKKGRKFHRQSNQRRALLKSLGEDLILREKFITTLARAKELSRFIEKKISIIGEDRLKSLRDLRRVFSESSAKKLIKMADTFKKRKGGWTRVIKIGPRKSDGANMAKIEIIKK